MEDLVNERREYKISSIYIPKEIMREKGFTMREKFLYGIISTFCAHSSCYASNKYFAEILECGEQTITNSISKLIESGFVYIEKFDGRKRWLNVTPLKRLKNK
jgi:hypothetical protein